MLSPFTGDGPGKYNVVYNVTVRNDGVNCGARIWALWKVLWKVFVCFRLKIGMWMVFDYVAGPHWGSASCAVILTNKFNR